MGLEALSSMPAACPTSSTHPQGALFFIPGYLPWKYYKHFHIFLLSGLASKYDPVPRERLFLCVADTVDSCTGCFALLCYLSETAVCLQGWHVADSWDACLGLTRAAWRCCAGVSTACPHLPPTCSRLPHQRESRRELLVNASPPLHAMAPKSPSTNSNSLPSWR